MEVKTISIEERYDDEHALLMHIYIKEGEILNLKYFKEKQLLEIKRLNKRVAELELDLNRNVHALRESETHYDIENQPPEDLFGYLKALLIELSHKEGNASINPDDVNVIYIKSACRYCLPVLFNRYALLSGVDCRKIGLVDSITKELDSDRDLPGEGTKEACDGEISGR